VIAEIEAEFEAEAMALPKQPNSETHKYLPVKAKGVVGNGMIRVLVSRKVFGAGYRIISPFYTEGRNILLDRGFVAVDEQPQSGVAGEVEVIGNLHWPQETDGFTPEADLENNIWYARDVDAMADHFGTEPILIVLREASFYDTPIRPMPVDIARIPNNHLQYAITWFSLAAIWLAMSLYFVARRRA
jgi:surfeit locus 1 family protein